MRRLITLLAFAASSATAYGAVQDLPTRQLDEVGSWQCRRSLSLGFETGNEFVAKTLTSCPDVFAAGNTLFQPLFAAASFETNSVTQQCWLSGYTASIQHAVERFRSECHESLSAAFSAGMALGELACRHAPVNPDSPPFEIAGFALQPSAGPNKLPHVVLPVRSDEWATQIRDSHLDGFLFGCIAGEHALLGHKRSDFIDANGLVDWLRLGRHVGSTFGQSSCPIGTELASQVVDTLTGVTQGESWSAAWAGFAEGHSASCQERIQLNEGAPLQRQEG